jgi:hypothetical protein
VDAGRGDRAGDGGKAEEQERKRHGRWHGETPGFGLCKATEHLIGPRIETRNGGRATKQKLEHEFEQAELLVGRWEQLHEDVAQVLQGGHAAVAHEHLILHSVVSAVIE